ncbi:copper amine oxidase N-terminal domain-containing protein [Paenibacillus sp. UNC499MF]|uniref:copper amine oxidase N-terminal domain-containing protein n=1 Tax=Paenibacillus sp. UNC499MF TaxID=1502751 RepID=UPI0008A036EF|nr:copper amine oxidase N-terminal domain-containing protein [Paenibacillus sp. UNC499MF]SEF44885.1 Copper amine oxidase N-terminal domain-containing protein [Paenibacillus sp. UNC499MF]
MKKKIIMLVAAFSVFAGVVSASSINGVYKGNAIVKVTVNGSDVNSEVPGINLDGTTMLPVRAVSEALGAEVKWDQNTYTAEIETSPSLKSLDEIAKHLKNYNIHSVDYHTDGSGHTEFIVIYEGLFFMGNENKYNEITKEIAKQAITLRTTDFIFSDMLNQSIAGTTENARAFYNGKLTETQFFETLIRDNMEEESELDS